MLNIVDKWADYELVDSGEGEKLERFGTVTVVRPSPVAIWKKQLPERTWRDADAMYDEKEGKWYSPTMAFPQGQVRWENVRLNIKLAQGGQVGVFAEQKANWEWLSTAVDRKRGGSALKILNLFAYTGGATIACASLGARVTHVDSSRAALMWASENAKLSGAARESIRWIQDGAVSFVEREIRRGVKYDGLIMDPPSFGRGVKGEVWSLDNDLPRIIGRLKLILEEKPVMGIISTHATNFSCLSLANLMAELVPHDAEGEYGELGIREASGIRVLPAGVMGRWKCVED